MPFDPSMHPLHCPCIRCVNVLPPSHPRDAGVASALLSSSIFSAVPQGQMHDMNRPSAAYPPSFFTVPQAQMQDGYSLNAAASPFASAMAQGQLPNTSWLNAASPFVSTMAQGQLPNTSWLNAVSHPSPVFGHAAAPSTFPSHTGYPVNQFPSNMSQRQQAGPQYHTSLTTNIDVNVINVHVQPQPLSHSANPQAGRTPSNQRVPVANGQPKKKSGRTKRVNTSTQGLSAPFGGRQHPVRTEQEQPASLQYGDMFGDETPTCIEHVAANFNTEGLSAEEIASLHRLIEKVNVMIKRLGDLHIRNTRIPQRRIALRQAFTILHHYAFTALMVREDDEFSNRQLLHPDLTSWSKYGKYTELLIYHMYDQLEALLRHAPGAYIEALRKLFEDNTDHHQWFCDYLRSDINELYEDVLGQGRGLDQLHAKYMASESVMRDIISQEPTLAHIAAHISAPRDMFPQWTPYAKGADRLPDMPEFCPCPAPEDFKVNPDSDIGFEAAEAAFVATASGLVDMEF